MRPRVRDLSRIQVVPRILSALSLLAQGVFLQEAENGFPEHHGFRQGRHGAVGMQPETTAGTAEEFRAFLAGRTGRPAVFLKHIESKLECLQNRRINV